MLAVVSKRYASDADDGAKASEAKDKRPRDGLKHHILQTISPGVFCDTPGSSIATQKYTHPCGAGNDELVSQALGFRLWGFSALGLRPRLSLKRARA